MAPSKLKLLAVESGRCDIPPVEFMYLVFTRMPGNSGHCCCNCVTYFER